MSSLEPWLKNLAQSQIISFKEEQKKELSTAEFEKMFVNSFLQLFDESIIASETFNNYAPKDRQIKVFDLQENHNEINTGFIILFAKTKFILTLEQNVLNIYQNSVINFESKTTLLKTLVPVLDDVNTLNWGEKNSKLRYNNEFLIKNLFKTIVKN